MVFIIPVISFEVNIVAKHVSANRMTVIGVLLHWTQPNSFGIVVRQNHGHLPLPRNCNEEPKFSRKLDVTSSIPIGWFISCNDSLFAGMTLTLHKSQVAILVSNSDEVAVHSWPLFFLQRQVAKRAIGLFYRSSLLRNNSMATNL